MAVDYFLKMDGVPGESERKRSAAVSLTVWAPFRTTSDSSGRNQPGGWRHRANNSATVP